MWFSNPTTSIKFNEIVPRGHLHQAVMFCPISIQTPNLHIVSIKRSQCFVQSPYGLLTFSPY